MDCNEASRLLNPLVDRELGLERSLEVETHLEGCEACAAAYRNLTEMRAALRGRLPYESAPDRLKTRLLSARLGADETPAPPVRRKLLGWGLMPAALAAIAITWYVSRPTMLPPSASVDRIADEALSGHLRSLMASHLADVMSSDQHTVKPYFAGKLDFSPPVIDLAKAGFPLVAGRLDYMDGHPAAALVYRRNRHIINLFVWPSANSSGSSPVTISNRGYQIVHWSSAGMTEWAISDLNAGELNEFAEDLRRPH